MWKTLDKFNTPLRPDAVEWYPESLGDCQRSSFFACALYELQEEAPEPERKGGIVALKARNCESEESNGGDTPVKNCRVQMEVTSNVSNIPGIYDMKWMKTEGDDAMLCTADAEGQVVFYDCSFEPSSNVDDIAAVIRRHSTGEPTKLGDGMALYVNICPDKRRLAVSSSKGAIHVYSIVDSAGSLLVKEAELLAHDFEAWVVHHDLSKLDIIYTGGDDSCLKGFDLRCNPAGGQIFCWKRATGGITSIASHPDRENELLVGSYDENLYIFDKRSMRGEVDSLHIGGGVWRLQWHPKRSDLLAVAAMHAGFAIVRRHDGSAVEGDSGSFSIQTRYTEHESLAYGIDWMKSAGRGKNCSIGKEEHLLASVSFYDRSLHLSSFTEF